MKKINIIAAAMVLVLSASCNRKIELQPQTFATFDAVSFSVDETAPSVSVPVSIYNPTGAEVQVTVKGVDGKAVNGVDYEIVSPASGILTFSGDVATQNIEVKINGQVGEFTNNKDFTIQIASATTGVSVGNLNTARVVIKDLDHPLASILGEYAAEGLSAAAGGAYAWTVTIDKNDDSVQKVNVIGLNDWGETLVGEVSDDMTVITMPFGQTYVASGYTTLFVGFGEGGYYAPSGNLILTRTETGWIQSSDIDDEEMQWGYGALAIDDASGSPLGWLDYIYPGVVLTKN